MMMTMMVCVRGWVFAGKVSPQLIQLAYKVPVSGSYDPRMSLETFAAQYSWEQKEIRKRREFLWKIQMGNDKRTVIC